MLEARGGQREADRDVLQTARGEQDAGLREHDAGLREQSAAGGEQDAGRGERDAANDVGQLHEAIATAYRYLNRSERTQAEMRAHLRRAGVDPRSVERAIEALVEDGQLDDRRFARLFIQDKRELEGWGSERIRQTLLGRGADPDLIEAALSEAGADDEKERALELLRQRFPSPPRDRRERDRALGVLIRKGYDPELALEAIAAHARLTDR